MPHWLVNVTGVDGRKQVHAETADGVEGNGRHVTRAFHEGRLAPRQHGPNFFTY